MKNSIFTLLLCAIPSFLFAQVKEIQKNEKSYFENNPTIGGDVIIKSASVKEVGFEVFKTFEIESLEDAMYYMDSWIMVSEIDNKYSEYKVAINGIISQYTFKPQAASWQSITLTDSKKNASTVKLKKGINTISVIGKGPEIPNVEFVKLSSSAMKAGISNNSYKQFVESIKSNTLLDAKYADSIADSISVATRSSGMALKGTAGENYVYVINIPVYYTTRISYIFTAGQSVNISTSQSGTYEHVIELFSSTNPSGYTWSSSTAKNGSLNVTIPVSGTYYLRLRAFRQYTSGLVNLTVNGTSYPNCVVAGTGIEIPDSYSTPSNFFTCKRTNAGDTWLFIEDNTGIPGKIRAFNDDGGSKSDGYSWGYSSLIKTSVTNIRAGLVSAHSSNAPYFTCDLYLGLPLSSSSLRGYFPNLAADNSFISAPSSGVYNCISWSVGKTSTWDFPSVTNLALWDNYYASYGYSRSGATEANAAIALWKSGSSFTHASVRKNSTIPKPHGFEWESKCGSLERVMHIKDALTASGYGNIVYYYKPISGTVNYSLSTNGIDYDISTSSSTLQESFLDTDMNNESRFTQSDLNQIAILKDYIPTKELTDFNLIYQIWEKTWTKPELAIYSNPYKYAESEEYNILLKYCVKYGKAILPLILDKLAHGDIFTVNLLKDLTYSGNLNFIDDITPSVKSGFVEPAPSLYSNLVDYSRNILTKDTQSILKSIESISTIESSKLDVLVTVNNNQIILNLQPKEEDVIAYVKLYNIYGVYEFGKTYNIPKGGQAIVIDSPNLKEGVYLVTITINGETITQKVVI